jgi:hypothetical protein
LAAWGHNLQQNEGGNGEEAEGVLIGVEGLRIGQGVKRIEEGEGIAARACLRRDLRLEERDDTRAPLVSQREREKRVPIPAGLPGLRAETGAGPDGFPGSFSYFFLSFFFFFPIFIILSYLFQILSKLIQTYL